MSRKVVVLRETARRDIDAAIDDYLETAGEAVALRFIDALEAAHRAIGRHPATGSPRYGRELGLPGLRSRVLSRFPYIVFYLEDARQVSVWRVLHAKRGIPERLRDIDA